jgi:glycosyltransferase involved in cell wall biosynthesis
MKTLLSINNYYYRRGGAETVFFEHNQLFEALGWQVVPFAMQHPGNLPSAWSDYFVDEIEFESKYSMLQKLARVPKVIYSLEARRKLDRLLQRVSPDICHAHNIYHHISPSILGLLRERGVPVVMTLHDLKIACPAYRMLNSTGICERCQGGAYYHVLRHRCVKDSLALSGVAFLESTLHRLLGTYVRHVSRFVVPSRFYISKFVEWGFPQALFVHVPNFIDTRAFEPAAESGETFVFAGRLSPEKGVATLVKAAALAKVPVQIAGTGPEAESLQRLAAETGAEVEFLGHLDSAQLRRVIARSRAVVAIRMVRKRTPGGA